MKICLYWCDILQASKVSPDDYEEMKQTFIHYYAVLKPEIKCTPSGWKDKWITFIKRREQRMSGEEIPRLGFDDIYIDTSKSLELIDPEQSLPVEVESYPFREISDVSGELERRLGAPYFKSYVTWAEGKIIQHSAPIAGHVYSLVIPAKHCYAKRRLSTDPRDQEILTSMEIKII